MDTNTNDYILVLEDKESKKLSVVSSVDAEGRTSWRTLPDSLMILQEPDCTDWLQTKWKVL